MEKPVDRGEMHGRINRAIQARVPNLDGVNLCDLADAILLAMREPTEAMKKEANNYRPMYDDPQTDPETYWQAMIDAALTAPR